MMPDLREFLAATGMTQAEFAALLQVSPRAVGNWTRRGAPLAVRALLDACRRLEPHEPANALRELLEAVAGKSPTATTRRTAG